MDLDTVIVGEGLEDIKFGYTIDQVKTVLGEPDSVETDDMGDVTAFYGKHDLEFEFWTDFEGKLGYINAERETLKVDGNTLWDRSADEIISFCTDVLKKDISDDSSVTHDDGGIQRWIEVEELNLTFNLWNGHLEGIDWGCLWTDEETPCWPEENK